MHALDEFKNLAGLFSRREALFANVEHIASALTPEPYKSMLVHDQHMTLAMERHFGSIVSVEVLESRFVDDHYCREIILTVPHGDSQQVVQYGLVRFDFQFVTTAVRDAIVAEQVPLGRILIQHNVLRQIDLGAILKMELTATGAALFGVDEGISTYGRLATIFCDGKPAVDLLEVSRPLAE